MIITHTFSNILTRSANVPTDLYWWKEGGNPFLVHFGTLMQGINSNMAKVSVGNQIVTSDVGNVNNKIVFYVVKRFPCQGKFSFSAQGGSSLFL